MIESMTGFGKGTVELEDKKITVEIKALNSKQFDLSTRIPHLYKEKEMQVRSLLMSELERGKVDLTIQVEYIGKELPTQINRRMLENYYCRIKDLSASLGISEPADWFSLLVRLPEVIQNDTSEADEQEWEAIRRLIISAISRLKEFRVQEGQMLYNFFVLKINTLKEQIKEIEKYEGERIEKIKTRIMENLEKVASLDYDKNRFEQEMIYYIEKLDVNEEKTRLHNHLDYFVSTLDSGHGQGKKLGFIAQEIGREINTLGSKSNHAEMQQIVVRMKDELEQIKEQVLNIL
ncbi:MAG: YicC family protein [Tannerellaceae bacterium]|nr:YicC family protein [Tannerellaceae bacterium]